MARDTGRKVYVAGHRGMVGSAIVRHLQALGYSEVLTAPRAELDLRDSGAVHRFLAREKPDFIFIAAARVGGIHANNTFRAEFLYDNLMMEANLIHGAHLAGIDRLMFLGSSCIYPRDCPQPIKEDYLLTGPLEYTNEPYAIAKIAGVKLCENYNLQYGRHYFSGMPTNTFGPGDNYHPDYGHVMAALILKAHKARQKREPAMTVWGSGGPRREFIYVEDLADACVFLMESGYDEGLINIGSGSDVTIRELAETVALVIGFDGALEFDTSRPDGTPRKLMDSGKLAALGWRARTSLEEGIEKAYQQALQTVEFN
ncbi:GDP-L-fucose synthase family protein [Allosphingosinicella sp.]|uniref:GDP-L-fucose synthase family protein n=1 Tax=Allosphingosinicella sp. TaxID=2823234 RepID=UPI0037851E65